MSRAENDRGCQRVKVRSQKSEPRYRLQRSPSTTALRAISPQRAPRYLQHKRAISLLSHTHWVSLGLTIGLPSLKQLPLLPCPLRKRHISRLLLHRGPACARALAVGHGIFLLSVPLAYPTCLGHALRARTQSLAQHARERASSQRRARRTCCCGAGRGCTIRAGRRGRGRGEGTHERAAEAHDLVQDLRVPEVVREPVGREDEDVVLLDRDRERARVVRLRRGCRAELDRGIELATKNDDVSVCATR